MTYNIQAGRGLDLRFDLERTAGAIAAERPDVVALQEVDRHWSARSAFVDEAAWLARRLDKHVYFAPIYTREPDNDGRPTGEFGLAVLSRFPIVSGVNHRLTRASTQVPDARPAPAPGFPEVVIDVAGVPLRIFDTHLDYRPDPAVRRRQVSEMIQIMAGRPGLLVGDFNAQPGDPELAPLWHGLTDPLTECGATYPSGCPEKRFDYIAVPRGADIEAAWVPDTVASDHRPVVVDLTLIDERP